jgi:hypothetical protein
MSLAIVSDLTQRVIAAQTVLDQKKADLNAQIATNVGLQEQADYHRQRGNENDLQIVNSRLTAGYNALPALTNAVNLAQTEVNNLTQQLNSAKASLTPAENQVIQAEAAVKVNESNMRLAAQQAEIDKKNYAQKTTKYIVIGVIGLIVIGGIIYYFRKKAK